MPTTKLSALVSREARQFEGTWADREPCQCQVLAAWHVWRPVDAFGRQTPSFFVFQRDVAGFIPRGD
jgi:hypothetical protein